MKQCMHYQAFNYSVTSLQYISVTSLGQIAEVIAYQQVARERQKRLVTTRVHLSPYTRHGLATDEFTVQPVDLLLHFLAKLECLTVHLYTGA